MPVPRGRTSTRVITNKRAIVLEAEWMVMPQRIANELKPLVKLASDQGWKIESAQGGTKLVWRGPKGEGPVYTGYRCQGRDLMNYRAELVRAGLKLDEEQATLHVKNAEIEQAVKEADENPMDPDELSKMLNTMINQLSNLHAKATLFDKSREDAKEWQDLAQEAQDAAEKAIKRLSEADAIIIAIRECFDLQPWAILPEIARLLGIQAEGPGVRREPQIIHAPNPIKGATT